MSKDSDEAVRVAGEIVEAYNAHIERVRPFVGTDVARYRKERKSSLAMFSRKLSEIKSRGDMPAYNMANAILWMIESGDFGIIQDVIRFLALLVGGAEE